MRHTVTYDPKIGEPKWQARWEAENAFAVDADPAKPKIYILDMFPYPSGAGLHVGHCEGYTATDVLARYKRARGFRVLHPMGWDAFGLPAELYAVRTGVHPAKTTATAIANFKRQIRSLGFSYDWSREIDTTDPAYYHWTQWIFLKLFERGLAYEDVVPINWCPNDRTGLANEEVKQGRCERCGTLVEKRNLRQWMLRITAYAERLLADLDGLDWPEGTLTMQREWIGRSDGADLTFVVAEDSPGAGQPIVIFTTRPDTLYGATYVVLAPEHPLVEQVTTDTQRTAVAAYVDLAKHKSERERLDHGKTKTGVATGAFAVNPVNGARVPIWVADYVLWGYGTGAIMAVPAHDQRDFEFAQAFDLRIVPVIAPKHGAPVPADRAFVDEGPNVVLVNSGAHTGLASDAGKKAVVESLAAKSLGRAKVGYKLRDWIFSRQRYWGEPIPIVHCEACGVVPVPEDELPVRLPDVERFEPSSTGESPLAGVEEWIRTSCPTCGGPARRETNTMPQWAGSCWYCLRFVDPKNDRAAWDSEIEKHWMPVDVYIGGAEHAVLHLLYSRFWQKVLYDAGYVSTAEPFLKLRHQGMVLANVYRDAQDRWHGYDEIEFRSSGPFSRNTGEPLVTSVEKMSKSRLNVINPDDVVAEYGADVLRLYEMFMGDFEQPKPWDTRAIVGVVRFVANVWRVIEEPARAEGDPHVRLRHKTIRLVGERIEALKFNTAIAAMMEYVNELLSKGASRADQEILLRLVSPFAPHVAEEGWERLGHSTLLSKEPWPDYEGPLTIDATVMIPIQVSGKTRGTVEVPRGADEAIVRSAAENVATVARALAGKSVVKTIFVPDRMLNLVAR
jgi:leucyl-tRNA synthetase